MGEAALKRYYDRALSKGELTALFNSPDYWAGVTSDWEGGILNPDPKIQKRRNKHYRAVAEKVALRAQGGSQARVLEVGCGLGQVVAILRECGLDAVGIDISEWAIEHAVTPGIMRGSIYELGSIFAAKEFDLVYSCDVLEHIPQRLLSQAFRELDRVGRTNYHIISCGSLPDDRDVTHTTMHPISWWRKQVPPGFEVERKV